MKYMSFRMKLTLVFIVTAMIEGAIIGSLSFFHSKDIVCCFIRRLLAIGSVLWEAMLLQPGCRESIPTGFL